MAYRLSERHRTCPYEPTHQILPHRMPQHIAKCRKNYPEMDMKTCPFNATHVIPSKDYQAHILECPDKAIVERDIYRRQEVEDALEIKRSIQTMPSESIWEEDWESEMVENPYNAKEVIINKDITRPPPPGLMGKSGRRAWRQAEIERVNRIKSGEQINDMEHPDISVSASMTNLGASQSIFHPRWTEPEITRSSLTLSKANLAMRADKPLRRPKALLQKNDTRIAANIFSNDLDEDLQAGEDSGAPQQMSKAALKHKKKREAARRKQTEDLCGGENRKMTPTFDRTPVSVAANVELTGHPETDKEIRKIKKKLDAIAKLKLSQQEGKSLEKNQLEKIAMEDMLMAELENLAL